jgi:hypothetical protein
METQTVVQPIAWLRLQHVSCAHAASIGKVGMRQHHPPEVIIENCDILGRGTDTDVKARLHWYATYHPQFWADAITEVRSNG